ncbi:hypothetical protein CPT_Stahl72 [Bacillus phage Stahl]|uniref:Uncharacterized protein n=1 Tax=Bacillus phage Stahl TaxID=1610832 RepID=A0A0E3M3E6_9CAUD|nr:hypothetical protein CPT_Stahl72 [Bacillus phage Stahl]AKA61500.1 hypothetical protein CPT_Stahl72 [Bacillus phage Stahl]
MGKRKGNGRKRVQKDTVMITLVNGSTIEMKRNVSKVRSGRMKNYIPCPSCQEFKWVGVKTKAFEAGLCTDCYNELNDKLKEDVRKSFEKAVARNGEALKRLSESDGVE